MVQTLGGFHHWMVRLIMRNLLEQRPDGGWEYPLVEEALREAGIDELEVYIRQRQNTVEQLIFTHTIMYILLE